MKRTWAWVGAAALAVVGASAGAQAQAPGTDDAQGRPGEQRMNQCGPQQGMGPGQGQGRGQGTMRGRGPGGRGPRGGGAGAGLRGMDLTEDQKTQLKALHEQTRQAVDHILTPEQKAKRRGGR